MMPLTLADKMDFLTTGVWDYAWLDASLAVGLDWRMSRAMLYENADQSSPLDSDLFNPFAHDDRHSI